MSGNLCNDWRITNQMNYLFRARLIKTTFSESSHSDHEHCEFCFAKFGNAEGLLQSGYCTLDKYHWVATSVIVTSMHNLNGLSLMKIR